MSAVELSAIAAARAAEAAEMIDTVEAAALADVTLAQVCLWAREGMPHARVDGALRYRRAAVLAWRRRAEARERTTWEEAT